MEFHKNLPKFLPNEKQKYEDELISQNEYDNIDKEIMEKVLTNKSSKNFVEEEDDNELFSEGFNHEGEKLYLNPDFNNNCSVSQININTHEQDALSTNPFTTEQPSQIRSERFVVKKPKNKGRKRKKKEDISTIIYDTSNNNNENVHSNLKKDNMIKKIRFHLIVFIINLLNDCLYKENNKCNIKIKHISKEVTSNLSIKYNNELLENKILFILSNNDIRDTYKNENKLYNKIQVKKIIELKEIFPLTNELLNFTLKDFYYKYVYSEKEHLIDKYGLKNAKNFNDFLNELREKKFENEYIEKLKEEAKDFLSFFEISRARKRRKRLDG